MAPMRRNSAPVEMPWFTIWYTAPADACVFSAANPSITKPRCATDEYATSRFMSRWARHISEP